VATIIFTLQEDQFTFLFIFGSVLTKMRNVSDKIIEKIKTNFYVWELFFRKPCLSWDTVKRYGTVKPEATDDNVIWRMRVACWITKPTDTHTIKLFNTVAFHGDNVYANALQCHVIRRQLLCFSFSAAFPFSVLCVCVLKVINVTPSIRRAATLLCLLCSKQFSSFSPFFIFFRIDFLWP